MIRYKVKKDVGPHYHKGVCYKRGDIVKVDDPSELGGALDKFDRLDPVPPLEEPEKGLVIKKLDDYINGYNVVNEATGRVVNDRPLTIEEAEALSGKRFDEQIEAGEDITEEMKDQFETDGDDATDTETATEPE